MSITYNRVQRRIMANSTINMEALEFLIEMWLNWDKEEETRQEIINLRNEQKWVVLNGLLAHRLEFGTAGLRGCMRAGFNSMNHLVVIQTAQGFCSYVLQQFPDEKERGIVIGYDGRKNSKAFAELTASIFSQNGIKVFLYGNMVATPLVPFGIRKMKCLAGVMVTASHNPKEDNGYKVYWSNGAQIIPPHDKNIQEAILQNLEPCANSWDREVLKVHPLIVDPFVEMVAAYNNDLKPLLPQCCLQINKESEMRFVYTAMHGVGYRFVYEVFKTAALAPVVAVKEQRDPDPDFPTVVFPNPEEGKSALNLSIKQANENLIDIILANDPDADRLAAAERVDEKWKVFTGNELGALLSWWAFQIFKMLHPREDVSSWYMLSSTVSSKIIRSIAQQEGFQFEETLTGFKWMANRATELMGEGKRVIFAFEEAIGFMFSTNVLDKDGISAACHLATMACYLRQIEKITLSQQLKRIYKLYGYHCNSSSYYMCHKPEIIANIFEQLRHCKKTDSISVLKWNYPSSILQGKYRIRFVRDLTTGVDTSKADMRATLPVSSSSHMITFTFENGLVVTLRTSGTEPKVKYYAEMCAKPEQQDWQSVLEELNEMVDAVKKEFLLADVFKDDFIAKAD